MRIPLLFRLLLPTFRILKNSVLVASTSSGGGGGLRVLKLAHASSSGAIDKNILSVGPDERFPGLVKTVRKQQDGGGSKIMTTWSYKCSKDGWTYAIPLEPTAVQTGGGNNEYRDCGSGKWTFAKGSSGKVAARRSAELVERDSGQRQWRRTDAGLFECRICFKHLKSLRGIELHVANHLNLRKFECSACKKKFNHSSALKNHIYSSNNGVCK